MAEFKEAVLTRKGIALLAKAQAEKKTIEFVKAVSGNGLYEEGEDISLMESLKNQKQEFPLTKIARQNETNVYIRFTITNYLSEAALEHGYYVTEIGLVANDPDEGEILYGIAIGYENRCDYLPAFNGLLPAIIGVDFLIEVSNADNVTIKADLSAFVTRGELDAKADSIDFDKGTGAIVLKSDGKEVSRVVINGLGTGLDESMIAPEPIVKKIAQECLKGITSTTITLPASSRVASSGEVEEAKEKVLEALGA